MWPTQWVTLVMSNFMVGLSPGSSPLSHPDFVKKAEMLLFHFSCALVQACAVQLIINTFVYLINYKTPVEQRLVLLAVPSAGGGGGRNWEGEFKAHHPTPVNEGLSDICFGSRFHVASLNFSEFL
jgi:hypothetical protein